VKTKEYWTLICLFLFVSIASQGAPRAAPPEVVNAAREGLHPFLKRIPRDAMQDYGFAKDDPLDQCVLGRPFLVHTITPNAINKYQAGDTVGSIISRTNMWYFPVLLKGEVKAILVLDRIDNRWTAVSFGYAELAHKLSKLRKQWPKSKGYNPKLVAVFQAKEYLFTIPEKDSHNLTSFDFVKSQRIPPGKVPDLSRLERLPNVIERLRPLHHGNVEER
jgi:hypothetical protein